ncbi:MAG: hypothetical protein IIW56_12480, partial [Oscillospiraceae bacterium]|nr:hypothetical protein [Oscillospiraceae bacterium]
LYQNYIDHRNANADVLGVQVPFYLQYSDNADELGPLGEVLSLANISLDHVRAGAVKYADLEGMLVIFLYTDILGLQFYGDAIKAARDEALQAVKDSGAQTEAQKLLVLNDWLAEVNTFDMPYIMGEDTMKAENPQKHRFYDAVYDVLYDMYEDSIYDMFLAEFKNGIEADMRNKFYIEVVKSMVADGYLSAAAADEQMIAGARQGYQQVVLEQITQQAYDEAYAAFATHEHELAVTWTWAEDLSAATVSAECKTGLESYAAVAAEISTSTTATCTEAGKTTYIATAEIAGITVTDTREIDTEKLGHDLDENFVCTRCQATIEGHEHKYDTKIAETAPTCTVDGSETFACDCGAEQVKTVVATGHENETVITKEATCTEEGSLTSTCKKCGEVKTDVIAVKAHAYDAGVVTTAATCTAAGVKTFTCVNCPATKTEDIPMLDHTYGEGVVTTEATCTAEGVKTFTCVNCPATKTEAIAKLPHVDENNDAVCDIGGHTMDPNPISADAPELAAVKPGTDANADRYAQAAIKAQEAALAEQAAAAAAAADAETLEPIINTIVYGAEDGDPNKAVETDLEKDAAAYAADFATKNEAALNKDARGFAVEMLTEQLGAEAAAGYMVDIDAQCEQFIESARTNGVEMAPGVYMTIDQIADQQMASKDKIINMGTEEEPYMCTPAEAVTLATQQAATQSTDGVLNFWEGSHFGALGEGKSVCLGYADAYSYLVQCMHPEYYTKSGNYKTASDWKTDVKELYYTNGKLDVNKGYYTDLVRITFDTDVTMFGQVQEDFNSDHFWNAARVDGQWYYVDPCYTDVFVEVMMRDRAETDGNVNHMYFMFSEDSARSLYDGYYSEMKTDLYAEIANDTQYEDSWVSRIISDTTFTDGYAYYVYSSSDLISMLDEFNDSQNNQNGMTETEYDTNYEFKLVRHKMDTTDIGDGDNDFEALIEFNHPVETEGEEESEETVARVYNPTTKALEDNAFLTALYAQHYADTQVYPSLTITCAKDGNLLYFNLSNYLLAYDLTTGEIIVVKEYTSVSAKRDKTNAFGAMAFSVVGESGGDLTVQNHPIAGIIKKADGKLYVSIGTNFSYISGKETNDKTHETPDDPAAVGEYGYEYEESNYNPNYNSYGNDQYDNSQYEQYGYEQETNDNDEFMWTANFVETKNMSSVAVKPCSTHTYEAVEVAANCEHNAYTVNMCATCGAVENGTYAEVADTIHNHHYIYFAETYYTKDDQNQNRWNSGECYVCTECGFSCEEPTEPQKNDMVEEEDYQKQVEQYEKDLAIWNNAVETAGHEYSVTDAAWAQDNTTVTFSKLTCDHCKARKANLDCLLKDNTIDTTLTNSLTVEAAVIGYSGDCTQGAVATYAASGKLEQGGTFYVAKDVKLAAGNHAYDIAATWNQVADEEGNAVLDANGKAQYTVDATLTCAICGDAHEFEAVAATLDTENSVAPTCTEVGTDLYTVTIAPKNASGAEIGSATAVLNVEVPALGHDFGEDNICTVCGITKLVITTQPKTTYTKMGDTMSTTVVVEGEGELKYQWYIKNVGSEKYVKSSITEPTYTCEMKAKSKDRRLICIVTDETGNKVQSKTVIMREAASIVTEPKTTYGKQGATIKVKIEASGDDLTYQWYLKNANGEKYTKSTIKDDTYVVDMSKKVDGRRIRCVVKDKYGNKVETKTVVLRMAATITEQPEDVTIAKGKTAKATVKAVGTDLTYQWYIKNKGSDKFVKSSITDATYTVKMAKKVDGREAYCVVKDKYGKTAKSDIITFTMKK